MIKNVKLLTYGECDCFLEYLKFKNDLIQCKALCCNKS